MLRLKSLKKLKLRGIRGMDKVINITVIGFLSIALVFSADRTGGELDLIDAIIDYTVASTNLIKGE